MAMKLDQNRKTYRSDVKSRSGKRLPGLEAHYQGLDLKETNISRALLPIIGRVGDGFNHEYDSVQNVYRSVLKTSTIETNRVIDISIVTDPGTATFNNGSSSSNFTNLVGQTFTIYNPFYGDPANTHPEYFTFEFTATQGADPRRFFVKDGLYVGWEPSTLYTSFEDLRYHPLNVHYHQTDFLHENYRNNASPNGNSVEVAKYGNQLSGGNYEIPLGFPSQKFEDLVKSITGSSTYEDQYIGENLIDPANFDFTNAAVYRHLASTQVWIQVVIERALKNVLPPYMKILNPRDSHLPTGLQKGPMEGMWESIVIDGGAPGSRNPSRVKLYYSPDFTNGYSNPSIPNNTKTGADVVVTNWNFADEYEYILDGPRVIEKDPRIFYEDMRSDYLRQTFHSNRITDSASGSQYVPMLYPVQSSQGTAKPSMAAAAPLVKMDEKIAAVVTSAPNETIVGELVSIKKSQQRTELVNTFTREYKYFEDVHYVDPDQQEWNKLLNHKMWSQWVKASDHPSEQAAFVQHLENLFDGVYARAELIPEHPMSGRIDVFDRIGSFYENTPQRILENSRNVVGATLFVDRKAFPYRCIDTWPKKVEETPVKMFEDVRGIRHEGRLREYWELYLKDTVVGLKNVWVRAYERVPAGTSAFTGFAQHTYTTVLRTHSGAKVSLTVDINGDGSDVKGLRHYPAVHNVFVGNNVPGEERDYIFDGGGNVIGYGDDNSVMFNDYFDQVDPAYLKHIEEERWSPIDEQMLQIQTGILWDHDNNSSTPKEATNRKLLLDRREWQEDDYLYANTGHTTIHSERVCGTIWQEYKR